MRSRGRVLASIVAGVVLVLATGRSWVTGAWPIVADGTVSTPHDGDHRIDELAPELAAA